MYLIAPDILDDARGLSVALCTTGLAIGFFLWLFGWAGHRFWIVLGTTVAAGGIGLHFGRAFGTQPLVAALLLAVGAGMLALALVRVVAFAAGGIAALLAARALAPGWNEPLVCFTAGGMVGLLLFRYWTMALTSLAGTLLMVYSGLCLADRPGKLDAVAWAEKSRLLLNWGCGVAALAGLMAQIGIDRWNARRQSRLEGSDEEPEEWPERSHGRAPSRSWWGGKGKGPGKRQAA